MASWRFFRWYLFLGGGVGGLLPLTPVSLLPSPPLPPPLLPLLPLPLDPRVRNFCLRGAGDWKLGGPLPGGVLSMLTTILCA